MWLPDIYSRFVEYTKKYPDTTPMLCELHITNKTAVTAAVTDSLGAFRFVLKYASISYNVLL